MDGAKSVTDTADISNDSDRQAFHWGRSVSVRVHGPGGIENPGGSRIVVL